MPRDTDTVVRAGMASTHNALPRSAGGVYRVVGNECCATERLVVTQSGRWFDTMVIAIQNGLGGL